MSDILIYKSNGSYFGYIRNGYLFSHDGSYLGWVENSYVWDAKGQFRGVVTSVNGNFYILRNRFVLTPVPRAVKASPAPTVPPAAQSNIAPISLDIQFVDAF